MFLRGAKYQYILQKFCRGLLLKIVAFINDINNQFCKLRKKEKIFAQTTPSPMHL